jgi:hypothetical protein
MPESNRLGGSDIWPFGTTAMTAGAKGASATGYRRCVTTTISRKPQKDCRHTGRQDSNLQQSAAYQEADQLFHFQCAKFEDGLAGRAFAHPPVRFCTRTPVSTDAVRVFHAAARPFYSVVKAAVLHHTKHSCLLRTG